MQSGRFFATTGLLVGTFFFALSMTPTLLPRQAVMQGLVSGFSLAAGYGVGVLGQWLWFYFELPRPRKQIQVIIKLVAAGICFIAMVIFLWQSNSWQNSVRVLMGMEEEGGIQPLVIGTVAIAVFLAVLLVARSFRWTKRQISKRMNRYVPPRVAYVSSLIVAFFLFWSVVDGVLFSSLLRMADTSYRQVDALVEPDMERPGDPMKTGSLDSILTWEEMGRQGRRFLSGALTKEQLQVFSHDTVRDPIRVYVGMNAADTPEIRAELALAELKRVGAFDRKVLLLITPTGTGWVDPPAVDAMEYLFKGDIASIAAQYSYLPSALSLIVEDQYGAEMARALFQKIYGYWTSLSQATRPRLYLHGLSLGALNSDRSFDFYDIINDPFDGVLWVGPPFRKDTWRSITNLRNSGSPAWLPRFRDGSVVRFANQNGGLERGDEEWGSFRIAYLQYASDPITFFEPTSFTREPEWMQDPRGPDVSHELRWYPVVTGVQLVADMLVGTGAPTGYGHEFAATHYLEAWLALAEPEGWLPEQLEQLRRHFAENY